MCSRNTVSLSCNLLFTIHSHSFAEQKYITMCFNLLNSRLLPLKPMLQVQSKAFNWNMSDDHCANSVQYKWLLKN